MRLGTKTTNPGELRTSISLKSRTVTTNAGGFPVPTWPTTIATVWAKWTNVHGQEAWIAQTAQAGQAATVLIRYRSDIDLTCAVFKGSDRWEIVSMDNVQERGEYLELKVIRKREG
jgi:SPP1 family predicted phage head-tail adaptor